MLDLVKPDVENKIRLKDLKRCKMTNVFFDTFFNLEKYLDNEQKDPFSNIKVRVLRGSRWQHHVLSHRILTRPKLLIG